MSVARSSTVFENVFQGNNFFILFINLLTYLFMYIYFNDIDKRETIAVRQATDLSRLSLKLCI